MKVYFNAFWGGFLEKENPVHCGFFLDLISKLLNETCEVGTLEESSVLCESLFGDSVLRKKTWNLTILFSGESRLRENNEEYTVVLCNQRTTSNRINCPLFLPFLYCGNHIEKLKNIAPRYDFPANSVVAILSNNSGKVRNTFLEKLEQHFTVTYAGRYKNNTGVPIPYTYGTSEFYNYISSFKFVITMENSREDTYITEKICHGFLSKTIPVYWGSKRVTDYFSIDRFLNLDGDSESEIQSVIEKMKELHKNSEKWLETINNPIFTGSGLWKTLDTVVRDCKALLFQHTLFPSIRQIYFICNKEYEPVRYERLQVIINSLKIPEYLYTFCCPTYKHTINEEQYKKYARTPLHTLIPWCSRTLRKAELSLFLNFRAVFEDVEKQYLEDVNIITFESDIIPMMDNIEKLPPFLSFCNENKRTWDFVHFGYAPVENKGKLLAENNGNSLIRNVNTRCTDTLLWNYRGLCILLNYMRETEDYGEPFDHYISRLLESGDYLIHAWSNPSFFLQMSNYGGESSEIQKDTI
jgi:hypothetical protein